MDFFSSQLKTFFDEKLLSLDILKKINTELVSVKKNDFHIVDGIRNDSWEMYRDDIYQITLSSYDTFSYNGNNPSIEGGVVYFLFNTLIKNLSDSEIIVEIYQTPEIHQNEIFKKGEPLFFQYETKIGLGEIISIKSCKDVLKFKKLHKRVLLSFLSELNKATIRWFYDSTSMLSVYPAASKDESSK